MKLKMFKPTSPGVRHQLNVPKNLLSKSNSFSKNDITFLKDYAGRSKTTGRITVRHKGGAVKKLYRHINFSDKKFFSICIAVLYDPYRKSFISQNYDFLANKFFKILLTENVLTGSLIISNIKSDLRLGSKMQLVNIPTGSLIHSLSFNKECSKYIRSAGNFGQLIQKDLKSCRVKLPSGVIKEFPLTTFCTIGTLSNSIQNLTYKGKAGKSRLMGIRPAVRGIAMNPVDHPHGGRTNGGMPSVTPWGIPTIGKPTVKKNE
jgi:large subunit ribosomal protein L2